MYASYNKNSDLDYGLGDKNDYSLMGFTTNGGYKSNCIMPGVTDYDKIVLYKSDNNINTTKGTFSIWVKPYWSSATNNYIFALKEHASWNYDKCTMRLYADKNDGTVFSVKNNSGSEFKLEIDKSKPESERWYYTKEWIYIIITWDYAEGKMAFYINGEKAGEKSISGSPEDDDVDWILIGAGRQTGINVEGSFVGKMDELRCYIKRMTDEEVRFLYEMEK